MKESVTQEQLSFYKHTSIITASLYIQNFHTMYRIADYALQAIVLHINYTACIKKPGTSASHALLWIGEWHTARIPKKSF